MEGCAVTISFEKLCLNSTEHSAEQILGSHKEYFIYILLKCRRCVNALVPVVFQYFRNYVTMRDHNRKIYGQPAVATIFI